MRPLLHSQVFPLLVKIGFLFAAACFFASLPTYSQQPQLDALATQAAQALDKAHVKKVAVLDFSGPGLKVTQLGRDLADQLAASFQKSPQKFELIDRKQFLGALASASPPVTASSDLDPGPVSNLFHVDGEVLGHIELAGGELLLTVEVRKLKKFKTLGDFKAKLTATDAELKSLNEILSTLNFAEGGAIGYTLPSCLHCPAPPFTDAAFAHKVHGVIVLDVVITADGTATDIKAKNGLPHGLTESAIREVQEWRFKPAVAPDGKPTAVHMLVEVDLNIY